MSGGVAIVLQARMGSSRLPGKSLAPVGGRSLLARAVERLQARSGVPVVIATTTLPADDLICDDARTLGVDVVRGPADDVLARYAVAVSALGLHAVVRATADNPAVDLDAPRRTLDMLLRSGADYVVDRGLPVGATVEAIAAPALVRAAGLAATAYDREHVTPYIRRDPRARALDLLAPLSLRRPDLRFTVDTADDLTAMRRLYAEVGPAEMPAPLESFILAADRLHARPMAAHLGVDAR
ncbi:MAG: NTP transferase domain-containing protein [Vicinamibacterales bacterium]